MEQVVEQRVVMIPPIKIATARFPLIGKTSLLEDRMPEKVLKDIEEKQTGKVKSKKELRNIKEEIERAVHYLPDGRVGFPAEGFLSGMIESTSFVGNKFFSKKLIRGLKIMNATNGLVPIKFKKRDVLVHNVKSNTKHSPQFHDWSCELEILYDKNNISEEDIATLVNYAGFYYGIGMWSPRCKSGGNYGMYELAKVEMKK